MLLMERDVQEVSYFIKMILWQDSHIRFAVELCCLVQS